MRLSYLSPKLKARASPGNGRGVFASEDVSAGEVLAVWGGRVIDEQEMRSLPERDLMHTLQIDEGFYIAPAKPRDPADFVNHSCDPNAGMRGQVTLVALREISAEDEVCYDYVMTEGTPYNEFDCRCGSPSCRGRVSAEDWRRPELWERYAGHFSPYIERRIRALQAAALATRVSESRSVE